MPNTRCRSVRFSSGGPRSAALPCVAATEGGRPLVKAEDTSCDSFQLTPRNDHQADDVVC